MELRSAVNSFRAGASLGSFDFTDATLAGKLIRTYHVLQLRSALDEARSALHLPPLSYTNSIAARSIVRAIDIEEIRAALKNSGASSSLGSLDFTDVSGAASQLHDLAVGPDGSVFVAYSVSNAGGVLVAKSSDGGATWQPSVAVPNSTLANREVAIAVGSDGVVHVVWWLNNDVYYSRSTDGGSTFSNRLALRTGLSSGGYTIVNAVSPQITTDGAKVYVVYDAYTKDSAGTLVGYNIWVSASTNSGASFQPEFPVGTISSAQKRPVRIRAANGSFSVLYVDETNYDLYYYRDVPSPLTVRVNAVAGAVQQASEMSGDFVVTSDGRNVYVVYSDTQTDNEGDILMCRSTDSGATWSSGVRVNDSTYRYQWTPAAAIDAAGHLHVIWSDLRSNSKNQIYYARSDDGGTTFTANVNLSASRTGSDFTKPHLVIDPARSVLYLSASRDSTQVMVARKAY